MADNSIVSAGAAAEQPMSARALRLGRRLKIADLEIANLEQGEAITTSPLAWCVGSGGYAALFPYGVAVLIGVSRAEEEALLQKLGDHVENRFDAPVVEASEIKIGADDKISGNLIVVRDLSPQRLVVVADALAKNVALACEEEEVSKVFEVLEPFASDLASAGRLPRNRRRMLRIVGHALLIHHRLFERVEVEEIPALLQDNAEIERLHERLVDAYHFKKRAKTLSRKLEAIEGMTSALTELLDAQRGMRLEATIVILIAVEIATTFYELFLRPG